MLNQIRQRAVWDAVCDEVGLRSYKMPNVHFLMSGHSNSSYCWPILRKIHLLPRDWEDEGVLAHEMIHVALNDLGDSWHHTLRMAEIEVAVCQTLGVDPTKWAEDKVWQKKRDERLNIPKRVSWEMLVNEAQKHGLECQQGICAQGGLYIAVGRYLFKSNRDGLRYVRTHFKDGGQNDGESEIPEGPRFLWSRRGRAGARGQLTSPR